MILNFLVNAHLYNLFWLSYKYMYLCYITAYTEFELVLRLPRIHNTVYTSLETPRISYRQTPKSENRCPGWVKFSREAKLGFPEFPFCHEYDINSRSYYGSRQMSSVHKLFNYRFCTQKEEYRPRTNFCHWKLKTFDIILQWGICMT